MFVFLNGAFVPEEQACISVFDRGFLYGDALFETLRLCRGRLFRWEQHLHRLLRGADFLRLRLPFEPESIRRVALELARRNTMSDGMLRLAVSRGVGPRGYSPRGADSPTVVMTLHPLRWKDEVNLPRLRVMTSSFRVPVNDPLGAFKTANKLVPVLARAEADDRGMDEALLLDTSGTVVEATSSNVFWIEEETVLTTPLGAGALPGVTREVVFELCRDLKVHVVECGASPARLQRADGMMLTNSGWGIVDVGEFDGVALKESSVTRKLQDRYRALMQAEVARG